MLLVKAGCDMCSFFAASPSDPASITARKTVSCRRSMLSGGVMNYEISITIIYGNIEDGFFVAAVMLGLRPTGVVRLENATWRGAGGCFQNRHNRAWRPSPTGSNPSI